MHDVLISKSNVTNLEPQPGVCCVFAFHIKSEERSFLKPKDVSPKVHTAPNGSYGVLRRYVHSVGYCWKHVHVLLLT
jgi:hypothetical protein